MSIRKKLPLIFTALALAAAVGTLGPVQRAIAQGLAHLTPLTGATQFTAIGYPCTAGCYVTADDIATYVRNGSGTAGTNGQFYVGVTGSAPKFATMSQDCTTTNAGVVTCTKTNNVALTSAATTAIGTSGATIPLLNAANTISGTTTVSAQLITTFGTPTIASGACGATTNGVITSGTNQAGLVTIGAASTATCTISFSATLAAAPNACVVFPASAGAADTGTTVAYVSAITTGHFVITGSALASTAYYYFCM